MTYSFVLEFTLKNRIMKKNILFLIGLFLAVGYSNAQDDAVRDQTRIQEHLMLRDGSMYLIKDQIKSS